MIARFEIYGRNTAFIMSAFVYINATLTECGKRNKKTAKSFYFLIIFG